MNMRTPFITATSTFILIVVMISAAPAMGAEALLLPLPGIGTVRVTSVSVESFDTARAWESYSSAAGIELGVENGIYRAYSATPGYVWGLNSLEHSDVVAQVDLTPLTPFSDIGAGVMCRADESNNGDGYYFMINANGYVSIRIGQGSDVAPLVDWQEADAVRDGIDTNTIRAVCVGEQLAMYVNDELVAEVTDSTYRSGFTGLAVAAGGNGVDMAFDNVTLYSIQL